MSEDRFTADGYDELKKSKEFRAARDEVIASVQARYAASLANAGILRRLALRLRMRREIAQELDKLAPPDALYLQSR